MLIYKQPYRQCNVFSSFCIAVCMAVVFSSKHAVYMCCILFLSMRPERWECPCTLIYSFFFVPPKKRIVQGSSSLLPIFLVNVPFTCAIYFFFLRGQKEKVPKRKKPPPKTDLALLRLPMTARQIRFAQTPLVPVIGKLRIRSSTGRHARNGRCWQSCRVDFA